MKVGLSEVLEALGESTLSPVHQLSPGDVSSLPRWDPFCVADSKRAQMFQN